MTYSISKAISLVNKEIDKRAAGNEDYYFPADFYGESSTENFVRLCVKSNHLDRVLIDQWSDGQQYIYIHNILHFWYGMRHEEADELLKMCNTRVPVAQLFSVTENGVTQHFYAPELDRTEIIRRVLKSDDIPFTLRCLGKLMTKEEYDNTLNGTSWTRSLEFDMDKQVMNDVEVLMYEDTGPQRSVTPHKFSTLPANYDTMYYARIEPPELNGESVIMPNEHDGEWQIVDARFLLSEKPLYLLESLNYGLSDSVRYCLVDNEENLIADDIRSIDEFIGENYERMIRVSYDTASRMVQSGYDVLGPDGKPAKGYPLPIGENYMYSAKPKDIFKCLGITKERPYRGVFVKEHPKNPVMFTVAELFQNNCCNAFVLPGRVTDLEQLKKGDTLDRFFSLTGNDRELVQAYFRVYCWGLGYLKAAEPTAEQLKFINNNLQEVKWEPDVFLIDDLSSQFTPNALIHDNSENITLDGYEDTYHVINSDIIEYEQVYLLESETRGEDVPHIVINAHGEVRADDMYSLKEYKQAIDNLEIEIER